MLNRLLQQFYRSPNNGKQLAALSDGRRLALLHSQIMGPGTLSLRMAGDREPKRLADFGEPVTLVGPGGVIPSAGARAFGGSMAVGPDGSLNLAWTGEGGIRFARGNAVQVLDAWSEAQLAVADDVWLGDLFFAGQDLCLIYRRGLSADREAIGLARMRAGRWEARDILITEPLYPPVGHVGEDGRIHLAWGDVAGRLWYWSLSATGEPEAEPFKVNETGRQPSILTWSTAAPGCAAPSREKVLIVYEDDYPHVHYAVLGDGPAQRDIWLTWTHPWFMGDLVHSPQLTVDRHGVPWVFFVDNTRRSTFWTRWLGERFSDIYNGPRLYYRPPHFDWNLLPVGRMSLEKQPPPDAPGIGMLLTCEPPIERQDYRHWVVPDLPTTTSKRVMFFDLLETAEMRGTKLSLHSVQKHPANPLLDVGPSDSFDCDRVFNHGAVLHDRGKFRMWYAGIRHPRPGESKPWWDTITVGYAESTDGVRWQRVKVGLVEWNGLTENNVVPYLRHAPTMVKDEAEPDPSRRYKSLYVWNAGEMGETARTGKYGYRFDPREEWYPAILFTSPDGLHLTPNPARLMFDKDATKPFSIIPECFFRDEAERDPAKRWKAYGFMSLNLRRRGGAYLYSADGLTWRVHPEIPVLDPSVRGTPAVVGGPESQIHDTVVFPYGGYYVALYQNQYDSRRLDIELAVSRDAETFVHVKPGEKIIPLGPPGAWDADYIIQTNPILFEDSIWIYYGGGRYFKVPAQEKARYPLVDLRFQPGLATLRRDGFTSVGLADGQTEGSLTTIPFRVAQASGLPSLVVNATCDRERTLTVELLDAATGQPIPGYSRADCDPLTSDALRQTVTWRGQAGLPRLEGKRLRLRFHFHGNSSTPRLYSFGFA